MSEIKGIDQIFPKKTDDGSASGSLKLWVVAGLVAVLAAGYAFVPTGSPSIDRKVVSPPIAATVPGKAPQPVVENIVRKSIPAPVVVEDVKSARKQEAKRQQQQQQKIEVSQSIATEAKAATKALGGRSCDCDTAELNLPAQCPDASCRQCKATCGIPGN